MCTKWLPLTVVATFVATAPRPSAALTALAGIASPGPVTDGAALLVAAVALVGWFLVGWLALVAVLLIASSAGPGRAGLAFRTASTWIAPYAARRLVAAALGLGLVALGASPAGADNGVSPVDGHAGAAAPTYVAVDLDWPGASKPSPASVVPVPRTGAAASAAPRPAPGRTVRPGESLWRIAAQQLGPGATAAQIAHAWPRWWQANRVAIGDDPDLIHPGTRLATPAQSGSSSPQQ